MNLADNLMMGLSLALTPINLYYCFVGVLLGMFVGVLPGIGSLVAISLLLPITFHIPSTSAIIMLSGVYYGATTGGSTASILLNIPGTPATAVTCLEGYPLARQGRAGVALMMATLTSFFGACVGILVMTFLSPALSEAALRFGPEEYFSMMVLGLLAASAISVGSPVKGIAMVVFGVLLGMVGADPASGTPRYTFGLIQLYGGISLVALAMGLFGVAEVLQSARKEMPNPVAGGNIRFRSMFPTADDWRRSWKPAIRGSGIGALLGALPGTGSALAAFMSYALEKKLNREPGRFGKGAIEGVAGPEAANNSAVQTAFIPTLTLGIPGDLVMALMLGALLIQNILPGPTLIIEHPDLFWGVLMSFWIGNVILVVLQIPLINVWVRILTIPYRVLHPAVLLFVAVGVYSVGNSSFDVLIVVGVTVFAYFMRLLDLPPAPMILGFVLGPMMEENFRRAMLIGRGNLTTFIEKPISASLLAVAFVLLVFAVWSSLRPPRAPVLEAQS